MTKRQPLVHDCRMPSAAAASSSAAAPPVRRLVLVPSDSPRSEEGVRRFRLARLRLDGRELPASERFAHLKRSFD
jgi:hypothetical protein